MKPTFWLAAAAATLADLTSKGWAQSQLEDGLTHPFIPGILDLTLTTNRGAAFGIGRESAVLMTVLALIIFLALLIWIWKRELSAKQPGWLERLGAALLTGGALGNICERLACGHVTDFLEFAFVSFPIFNLADIFIDIGVALILASHLFPMAKAAGQPNSAASKATLAGSSHEPDEDN